MNIGYILNLILFFSFDILFLSNFDIKNHARNIWYDIFDMIY